MHLVQQIEELLFGESAADFNALDNGFGGFCPFEAIGMVNQEIKHSNYLGYLLQPSNPHGLGDSPLRKFLHCVADASGEIDKLEIYTRDIDDTLIRREWNHIDILVEIPASFPGDDGWVIAVEVKVNAQESDGQLSRYADLVRKTYSGADGQNWKTIHIFLTPDGRLPSEENQAVWAPMGYGTLVDALEGCISPSSSVTTTSQSFLSAYLKMLRRHHLDNDKLEELAKRLWKKHPEALSFLAERRPDPVSDFKAFLSDHAIELAHNLSSTEGIPEIEYIENSSRSNIRFCVKDWLELDGLSSGDGKWTVNKSVLAFELYSDSKGQYALKSLIGPGDSNVRQRLHDAAIKINGFNSWKLGEKWFQLKRWDLVKDLESFLDQNDQEEARTKIEDAIRKALLSVVH